MVANILMIGTPKYATELPRCIVNPMEKMKYLLVLAKLDYLPHQYVVCQTRNRPGRNNRCFTGIPDGVRIMTLHEKDLDPVCEPGNTLPDTLQELNYQDSLKLQCAIANCMVEIHRAKFEDRNENFDTFVDTHVYTWPYKYTSPGMKMVMIWEDTWGHKHAVACPCMSRLVRLCPHMVHTVSG